MTIEKEKNKLSQKFSREMNKGLQKMSYQKLK